MMVLLQVFWEFFKTGLFSFGGGLATLPFLYEMAEKYPWISAESIGDMIAISESTPGPIGVNMATFTGYNAGFEVSGVWTGILGGVLSTFALVLPAFIMILLIASFLDRFKKNPLVESGFYGLRPAVTGLIAAAGMQIAQISIITWDHFRQSGSWAHMVDFKALTLLVVVLVLTNLKPLKKLHPVIYITAGAVVGMLLRF